MLRKWLSPGKYLVIDYEDQSSDPSTSDRQLTDNLSALTEYLSTHVHNTHINIYMNMNTDINEKFLKVSHRTVKY